MKEKAFCLTWSMRDTVIMAGIWTKYYEIDWSVDSEIRRSKAAMETSIGDASALQSELNSNPVLRVEKLTEQNKPTLTKLAITPHCYRCGGNKHMTHNRSYKH